MIRDFIEAIGVVGLVFGLLFAADSFSQGEVKQCINLTTGEIITVRANFPCPWNTTEY